MLIPTVCMILHHITNAFISNMSSYEPNAARYGRYLHAIPPVNLLYPLFTNRWLHKSLITKESITCPT